MIDTGKRQDLPSTNLISLVSSMDVSSKDLLASLASSQDLFYLKSTLDRGNAKHLK